LAALIVLAFMPHFRAVYNRFKWSSPANQFPWRIDNQRGSIRPWSRRPVTSNVHGAKPYPQLFSASFCGSVVAQVY